MKRKKEIASFLALSLLFLGGCQKTPSSAPASSNAESASDITNVQGSEVEPLVLPVGAISPQASIDLEFSANDLDVGYEESEASYLEFSGDQVTVTGSGASYNGGVVTITAAGTYVLSGTLSDGQVCIEAGDSDKIHLVLNGVTIHCEDNPAIFIKSADKVFLTMADGSENDLSDGTTYVQTDSDSNLDGVIFSKADLAINGTGTLKISANYKHAIVSKDDLIVTGGQFVINAVGGGLHGKDCVKISGGTFQLNTGGDAIQSSNAEDVTRGFVYIAGGTYEITAETDGIQAETVLLINGGNFTITTGNGSQNASVDAAGNQNQQWGGWGVTTTDAGADDGTSDSAKALKAGTELIVNGGDFNVDSSDDSLHCNGDLSISGGTLTISSGDDGIHADDATLIEGGEITILKSYEGIEGASVTISGGTIHLTANDDGVNAAGGNDGSAMGGRPGQNSFTANSSYFIRISGGTLTVNAAGDGLDSNGPLYVEGGTTFVNGPTNSGNGALDYDGTAEVTGGTILAIGSSGMAQGFSGTSTQCSFLYNFGSAIAEGSEITLVDASGNTILSYTAEKSFQSVAISAPELVQGQTYQLSAGGQNAEITLTSIATNSGGGNAGGSPMGGGGRGGRQIPSM
ncbi:MAG: carbohydrate-binding domain-containing protein [Oscillospiraceae bacterium]|nr:carbohydrate-binding domain-containing protein [Oscillospiraceae bacterium]